MTGHCAQATGCGVCSTPAAVGGKCNDSSDCGPGLGCSRGGVCFIPSKLGEACTANQECGLEFYCSAGKCIAKVATAGTACTYDPMDNSCSLAAELLCDQKTSTCIATTYGAKGATCDGGALACEPMGGCYGPANAPTGMCQDLPKMGEACDPTSQQDECAKPYRCISTRATGGSCGIPTYIDPSICN